MSARILEGVVVGARRESPATATCARHLELLGAEVGPADEADVVLDAERHSLVGGGLVDSETTAQAALGLTDYVGPFGEGPVRTGCDVASSAAGFCGALVALARLRGSERPVQVSLSPLRALASLKTIIWAARTRPDEWSGTHVRSRERLVDSGYATRDGRITLDFPFTGHARWRELVEALGLPPTVIDSYDSRWYETVGWGDDVDEARPVYESCLRELSTEDAVGLVRRHGGSSVPFLTVEQCRAHPQSSALGIGDGHEPGLPWSLTGGATPAERGRAVDQDLPLAGLRVVDFGVGGVGPFAATLLAWLGADVVKVEAPNEFIHTVRPTSGGIGTTYAAINQGKRSIRLDLKHGPDHELARSLVSTADVVLENFRPGALERLGLGFDDLRALSPSIVYCSVTGFGPRGPLAGEPCTDPHMQAFSGFAALNAGPDGLPRRVRYYALVDLVTSCAAAEAVCAGLLLRGAGGEAVRVETSMLQALCDVTKDRGARPVPDAVYPAADGHVALTCDGEAAWARLVGVLATPVLEDESLARRENRVARSVEIDREIGRVVLRRPAAAWAQAFERAGVACVRVLRDEDVLARRDLWDDGVLRELPTSAGRLIAGGPPWSPRPGTEPPQAPDPGEHTARFRSAPEAAWA